MAVRISLMARPHCVPGGDVRLILDVARAADAAGLHSIQFGEHLLIGNRPDRYPYGPFAHVQDVPWLEPMTTLGAMAAVTQRIRLSTSVLLAPLRAPALLAKTIATLDVLSSGRAELGLGVGWQPEEYAAVGLDWESRFRRFEETVAACRALWGEQPVTFKAEGIELDGVYAYPRPVQARLPLLFGLKMTAKNAERLARLGDGWCPPSAYGAAEVAEGAAALQAALAPSGRGLRDVLVRASLPHRKNADGTLDVPACFATAGALLAAGANVLAIATPAQSGTMGELAGFIEAVAREAEKW